MTKYKLLDEANYTSGKIKRHGQYSCNMIQLCNQIVTYDVG